MSSLPEYLLGFDTETTGVSVSEDRIVTASAVLLNSSNEMILNWEWLINPGVEIAEGASEVHGITTEYAAEHGANPKTSVFEIASILRYYMENGVPVVAYNAAFDFSLLNAECKRHLDTDFASFFTDPTAMSNIIDPYVIDKRLDKYRKGSRTLTASAGVYSITLENAHASFDDCVAAVGVARALWAKFKILQDGDQSTLFEAQQGWYREQQEGLAAYFKKQGKEADINTVWPIST